MELSRRWFVSKKIYKEEKSRNHIPRLISIVILCCLTGLIPAQNKNPAVILGGSCASPDGSFFLDPFTPGVISSSSSYTAENAKGHCYNNLNPGQTYCWTYRYPAEGPFKIGIVINDSCGNCGGAGEAYVSRTCPSAPGCAMLGIGSGCGSVLYDASCAVVSNGVLFAGDSCLAAPPCNAVFTFCFTVPPGCSTMDVCPVVEYGILVTAAGSSVCAGNCTTITASVASGKPPFTYLWSPSGQTTSSIAVCPTSTMTYTVSITDSVGSTAQDTALIQVPNVPASAQSNTTINIGAGTTLTAAGGGTYSWVPATGLSCTNCPNPVASPTATTDYCVFVTNVGCSDSACVRVAVDLCSDPFIPRAFSPNNDNANDNLCVYSNCIETMTLAIFNRWGEKVFESTDPRGCWDGTFRDKKLGPGVFAYYFQATMQNGKKVEKKGSISLVK